MSRVSSRGDGIEPRVRAVSVQTLRLGNVRPPVLQRHRRGTVLIIVAGLCALMASLSIAFLGTMRNEGAESLLVMQDAQARIMFYAACNYIQEAGRIGWDRYWGPAPYASSHPSTGEVNHIPIHEETFGWVDVRDGSIGPRRQDGQLVFSCTDPVSGAGPEFPAVSIDQSTGAPARFPMFVWKRTRFAISPNAVCNPINTKSGASDFGLPLLRYPDPQPAVDNGWTPGSERISANLFDDGSQGSSRADYLHGDPTPRPNSTGLSWFRLMRIGPARFLITVGAGSTLGFRSWKEVVAAGALMEQYFGDPSTFEVFRNEELRMWYLVEWSPAVAGATYQCIDNEQAPDHYQWRPFNPSHEWYPNGHQSQPHARNMVGTIRWSQKLLNEPPSW
jgi:hypothetical protein